MRRLKPRRGQSMSWMVVTVIVIALVIAVAVMLYMRTMGALNSLATLTGSGELGQVGSLTLTVTASGGSVTIEGIVLLSSSGVVATIGTTPGYTGPFYQTCRLGGVFINGASGPLTPPWVLSNGQSASFIFYTQTSIGIIASLNFQSSTSGCTNVNQAIIFYNGGKTAVIPVEG